MASLLLAAALVVAAAPQAAAQRISVERSFDAPAGTTLDVSTIRGAIEVSGEPATRVVIRGTATVRVGFNVPANALELAQRVAANPPVRQDGRVVRLSPPAGDDEQRAVTVSYRVVVPVGTDVRASTVSGATAITGTTGRVSVKTGSGATDLSRLGGSVVVLGRSGAVRVDQVTGDVAVSTQSGGITLRDLGGGLRVRTQSGGVVARFTSQARGQADVETSSSSIDLTGVRDGLTASSQSGHIRASGAPGAPWDVTVRSSSVELFFDRTTPLTLDATSGSGDVHVAGLVLGGASLVKGSATGTLGGGGPLVRASTRSGSVRIGLGR